MKHWRLALVAWVCCCLSWSVVYPQTNMIGGGIYGDVKVSSGFTGPASFGSALKAWWKADTQVFTNAGCTTVATNGGVVECLKDQSGDNITLQSGSGCTGVGTQGTLNTTGLNGKAAVVLSAAGPQSIDGKSNGASCLGSGFAWASGSPQFGVWIAATYTASVGSAATLMSWQNGAGNADNLSTSGIRMFGMNGNATHIGPLWNGNDNSQDHVVAAGTTYCFSAGFDGTTFTSYVGNADAVAHTWAVALSVQPLQYFFGTSVSGNDTTHGWDGMISEIVMIQRTGGPTSTDRSNMQTYLSTTRGYGC